MRKEYILGEVFPVKFLVHSEKGEPFRVLAASWELLRYKEVESEGDCRITQDDAGDTYLDMTLEPHNTGCYTLLVTFRIGEATIKRDVRFDVKDV